MIVFKKLRLHYMKKFFILNCFLFLSFQVCHAQRDLTFYIETAKKNSPLINDNLNQSKAVQFDMERMKALYTKPLVSIMGNYLFSPIISQDNNKNQLDLNPSGADKYLGYDLAAANGGLYQAQLNITQPLFNGRRYVAYSEQLKLGSQINQNLAKLSGHDLEKVITDQYILCLQDLRQSDYAKSMSDLIAEQKTIIEVLVQNSIYKQSDLLLLNIEYQNMLGQLTTFKATYARDLMDLNVLAGLNDTSTVTLANIDLQLAPDVKSSAFRERFRLDSLNLLSTQKIFDQKYKPQLSLFANAGLNAVYLPTLPQRLGSAGLTFTYNLFDGGQRNLMYKRTNILMTSVSAYKENFMVQNSVRKKKVLNELQSYTSRMAIAEQQLKDYKLLLNAYKKEILSGQMSIINYVMTLKNNAVLQRDYILLFSQKQILINTYNYWNW
jgi:outer membrane protein TolC